MSAATRTTQAFDQGLLSFSSDLPRIGHRSYCLSVDSPLRCLAIASLSTHKILTL
jgi:hypothetical protein